MPNAEGAAAPTTKRSGRGKSGAPTETVLPNRDEVIQRIQDLVGGLEVAKAAQGENPNFMAALSGQIGGVVDELAGIRTGIAQQDQSRVADNAALQACVKGLEEKLQEGMSNVGDLDEAVQAQFKVLQNGLTEALGAISGQMGALPNRNDFNAWHSSIQEHLDAEFKRSTDLVIHSTKKNSPVTTKVYRGYKKGVRKMTGESSFWRTTVYIGTAVVLLGVIGEAVGYFTGVKWCRPSTLWTGSV